VCVPSGAPSRRVNEGTRIVLWCAVVTLCSLLLRAAVPPLVLANGVYDDQMFVRGAHFVLTGRWLGPFIGPRTLAKGPGYPLFVAACSRLGVPVLLAQHVLHLGASATLAWVAYRLTKGRLFGAALYTVLALDPSFFGTLSSQFVRDNVYASVSLLLVALVARGLIPGRPAQAALGRRALLRSLGASAFLGALFAAYWLTREERPWLLPALALLLAVRLELLRRSFGGVRPCVRSRRGVQRVAGIVVVTSVAIGLVLSVKVENSRAYGVAVTNDVTEGSFAQAFGQWQAVRAGPVRRHVPINRAMREALYAVSPAAREIQPGMEQGIGRAWISFGCRVYRICDDVAGGWTQWALRTSLDETKRYPSAVQVQNYWRRVSTDIAAACERQALSCQRKTPTLLPQPDTVIPSAWFRSSAEALHWVVTFRLGDQLAGKPEGKSVGSPAEWQLFASTVPGVPRTLAEQTKREKAFAKHVRAFGVLEDFYRLISLPLLLVAPLGYVVSLVRRRPGRTLPAILGAAAGVGLVVRVVLIGLIDATDFPASHQVYLLPGSGLLIAFTAVGLWLLVRSLLDDRFRALSGPRPAVSA